MDKESQKEQKILTPEQIRVRNRKAIAISIVILAILVTSVVGLRYLFLGKGFNFGNVNGVSTGLEEKALTKINFIDSKSSKTGKTFGNIKTPFLPATQDKLWLRFVSGSNVVVGYLDKEIKFTKVYTFPDSVKIIRLLDDNSVLFTDEPYKEEPSLYYQNGELEPVRFSTLDFLDSYRDVYFDPDEKLIYILTEDPQDLISLVSINEKGQSTNITNALALNSSSQILLINSAFAYFQKDDGCIKLTFANMNFDGVDCESFSRNPIKKTFKVTPSINTNYSSNEGGELISFDNSGNRTSLLKLEEGFIFSKLNYSVDKLVFTKAGLAKVSDKTYISKDQSINILDLSNNQVAEVTNKLPESSKGYYWFSDKLFSISDTMNPKLTMFVKEGSSTYIYLGDSAPTSYIVVNQNWKDVDLGMVGINVEVLSGNYLL